MLQEKCINNFEKVLSCQMMGVATLFRGITESFRRKLNLDEILIMKQNL